MNCTHCAEDIGLSWAPQGDPDTPPGYGWADGNANIHCRSLLTDELTNTRHRPKLTFTNLRRLPAELLNCLKMRTFRG